MQDPAVSTAIHCNLCIDFSANPFPTEVVHTLTSMTDDAPAAKGTRFVQDLQAGKKVTIVIM
jgi:hypothetical protein